MADELDKILNDIQAETMARDREREQLREDLTPDETAAERIRQERQEKVEGFKLTLDLEEDAAAEEPGKQNDFTEETDTAEPAPAPEKHSSGKKKKKKKKKKLFGGFLYVLLVVLFSLLLAVVILVCFMDISGLTKSNDKVSVTIPQGATTQSIAEILKEEGLIDYPLIFRLYSRFTEADGTYQPHEELDLSADMGYSSIIAALQESKPRESVTVTIPEGYTLKEIAALLEKKEVCSEAEFLKAVEEGDFSEFSFVQDIPTKEDNARYANRIYRLEGYLFPDTYEFYVNGSADTVIRKMLKNFENRLSTSLLSGIRAKGLTVDEAVILASIIQAEVSNENDMARVSRVLYNRMEKGSEYPRLECCTTQLYLQDLVGRYDDTSALALAYDTYLFEGLPVGAIGNPGIDALKAVTQPSSEDAIQDCYFFVADTRTGITYFNRTYKQHQKKCRELGLDA